MDEERKTVEAIGEDGKAKEKKPRKKVGRFYRWQVVVVVLVVIAAVGGAGMWKFHETPEFCEVICHNPHDPFNPTYYSVPGEVGVDKWGNEVADSRGMLSAAHREYADANCLSCHKPKLEEQAMDGLNWVTGNFYSPLSERSLDNLVRWEEGKTGVEFCLNESCHNMTKAELTQATSKLERNPHAWHHIEYTCSDCHKSHRASVMVCSQCHDDSVVPEGWLSYQESTELPVQYGSFDQESVVYAD